RRFGHVRASLVEHPLARLRVSTRRLDLGEDGMSIAEPPRLSDLLGERDRVERVGVRDVDTARRLLERRARVEAETEAPDVARRPRRAHRPAAPPARLVVTFVPGEAVAPPG